MCYFEVKRPKAAQTEGCCLFDLISRKERLRDKRPAAFRVCEVRFFLKAVEKRTTCIYLPKTTVIYPGSGDASSEGPRISKCFKQWLVPNLTTIQFGMNDSTF